MKSYCEIEQLDDHSWVISEGKGNGRTHCYLLEGESKAVLIDTGLGLLNMKKICNSLTKKKIEVINTHGHLDHISKNYQFEKVYLHSKDESLYELHTNPNIRFQFHKNRYLKKGYPTWFLNSFLFKIWIKPMWTYKQVQNRVMIEKYKRLDIGNRLLEIIETSGHTQGSVCIYDTSRKWLFSGDTICEKGVLLHFDEASSVEEYLKSLIQLQTLQIEKIYSGHQKIPLSKNYLNYFIECAQLILAKEESVQNNQEIVFQHNKATITYRKDKIRREEG